MGSVFSSQNLHVFLLKYGFLLPDEVLGGLSCMLSSYLPLFWCRRRLGLGFNFRLEILPCHVLIELHNDESYDIFIETKEPLDLGDHGARTFQIDKEKLG